MSKMSFEFKKKTILAFVKKHWSNANACFYRFDSDYFDEEKLVNCFEIAQEDFEKKYPDVTKEGYAVYTVPFSTCSADTWQLFTTIGELSDDEPLPFDSNKKFLLRVYVDDVLTFSKDCVSILEAEREFDDFKSHVNPCGYVTYKIHSLKILEEGE